MDAIEVLKTYQNFAVIGVTNNPDKYGYKIYQRLIELGKTVYGISPIYKEIDGTAIFPDLDSVNQEIDVAVFVVSPKYGYDYVTACKALNVKHIWLQPGTYDEMLMEIINDNQLSYYQNCVLVESRNL